MRVQNAAESNNLGITVRYIYSACIVTITPDTKILHDPWFTGGVYHGAWFHFPEVKDPINVIGDVDFIYVSHVHPDHYDAKFIKEYFAVYGKKEVLIADHMPNHLANKMRAEGITPTIVKQPLRIGSTSVELIPHKTGSSSDLDSAIIVKYQNGVREHSVVNANDIVFDEQITKALQSAAANPDILLCGYTGAGPYPQTYFEATDPALPEEANRKREAFFDRYRRVTKAINAKANIPFAGKYVLGGKLADLNSYRGVADAVEVLAFDEKAVVLADAGGEICTSDLVATSVRTEKYSERDFDRRLEEIRGYKMDYESLIPEDQIYQLPIKRLLVQASRRAVEKSECTEDYYFVFALPHGEQAIINANKSSTTPIKFQGAEAELPQPRSEIIIDPRFLFCLLTYVHHWNNAEVGSQYMTRRIPNVFDRTVQSFLNNLTL
jgi:UDP-MurNAc hydroxylase